LPRQVFAATIEDCRRAFPDLPFLGTIRVNYMKKSVDPQFRSR
jgi:hypothetical protein